ncbi:MAG TPA: transcriptional regulator GcvA [Candidatus Eisenbacteria bacterium]|nr:transcriptional regulator GcvA [Candidatus Eisenbacteria bacterium]
MREELPPVAFLRAFSRAAETLSFKDAAADLGLSPSALSRQIQALEAHLGIVLFRRLNPGLEITDEGRRYLVSVNRALAELRRGQEAVAAPRSGPLRVSALESFTESWLIPHLADFERACPGIELQVEATLRYADFTRDPVDVAIRFGTGPWGDLHSEPIVDMSYFPVCSPALLRGDPPLREPAGLRSHTLIHVSQTPDAWRGWLTYAGLADLEPARAITYDHLSIALSAAEAGRGVALASQFLCEQRLAAGRLCVPFDLRASSPTTYHLVCRPEGLDDPRITAFRDWLVEALA